MIAIAFCQIICFYINEKDYLVSELKKVREAQLFCKKSSFSLFYSAPSVVKIF
jgi:hypothetical protein